MGHSMAILKDLSAGVKASRAAASSGFARPSTNSSLYVTGSPSYTCGRESDIETSHLTRVFLLRGRFSAAQDVSGWSWAQ